MNISIDLITIILSILGFFVVLLVVLYGLRFFVKKKYSKEGKYAHVTLMVTIPRFKNIEESKGNERVADVQEDISIAESFFAAIGGLKAEKGFVAWLRGRVDELALEIVSHQKLITFYITVPRYLQEFIQQQLHAQYSSANIEEVTDFNIFSPNGTVMGGYLIFKRENALPIKTYKELESDPLNAITNALSKVQEDNGVAIQYIVRSARSHWRAYGKRIVKLMKKGFSYKEAKKGGDDTWKNLLFNKKDDQQSPKTLSPAEQKMMEGIENKASKAGMEVNIRIIASGKNTESALADLNQVIQAFHQYNIYEYGNAFTKVIPKNKKIVQDFIYRRFNERYRIILNTEEMASLWHLPLPSTETPNIRWLMAKVAPPPPNIPQSGFKLGYNEYRGHRTDIYMKREDRTRHMYIIGKTGTGKSWFLRYLAAQDIRNGEGVCVIDPHGDLVEALMGMIPKERIDDVVYFNPSDMERPMGLNMLEAPNENMRDFAVQEMISIFYMLFPPEMIGPMFEHNMRNFMLTLMADLKDPGTLVEIPRMIADDKFQKKWIARVTDPVVRSFWDDEMAKTSDYHKSEMMGYLVSKVGRFVENEMMRNIIGQAKSSFNFRQIMDEGKILLVNLSKGLTGDVNANLLGLILVSKLQMAAFTRAEIPEEERRDFYLYMDEFQNFITPSIATILSEARKYRLNLIMAHQYMGQLVQDGKTEIRDAVLGNVGSMMCSRIGPEDTEVLAKVYEPVFSPFDLMNNEKFTWNTKIVIDNSQTKPFTLKTEVADKPNPKLAAAIKEMSRLKYGRPREEVEAEIIERAGIGELHQETKQPPMPPTI
ncbi:DUF87 domain-containing protein [Candidatus Parcubacteria bacterium]|nr:MAG: DUF87 domain-containing protein [Candidatus Parcubacteria bacterium]